tara:strand:+ start:309 stop:860 length:552 start_codon:yes stop_codon:yes gene_type:complete
LKFITTIISGVIVGALGVYFTLDWQEENLIYSVTAPAKFGEIIYQNIEIENTGWNPAVNIKLYVDHPNIDFSNVQSKASIKDLSSEKDGVANIERIRRDEIVTISTAYEGQPLFGTEIKIASDRSIAKLIEHDADDGLPWWAIFAVSIFGFWFTIGILASISIPAYKDYVKRAKQAQAEAKKV